jgi:chemotaxis protein histidine kinase CheA
VDLTEFLSEFQMEAGEKLDLIGSQLLRLERDATNQQAVREMFLAAHTVKGGASMMRLTNVEALAHAVEDLLSSLRDGQRNLDEATADLLFQAIDRLRSLISSASGAAVGAELDDEVAGFANQLRASNETRTPAKVVAQAGRRALVVEESATVRELERLLLEDVGYEVETCADGRTALARITDESFHLVVAGVQNETLNGFELCADLRVHRVAVVLTSAEPTAELERKASECGARALIRKGSVRDDRLTALARHL